MRLKLQDARVLVVAAATAMALSGCGVGVMEVDEGGDDLGLDEASLGSYPGLTEGSRDAIGVLKLANEASRQQLTAAAGVGLVSRTAKSILARRNGPDGLEATTDDQLFTSLSQLFAVKYVGVVSVRRLLDYARAHGYVPPAPPQDDPMPTCDGPPAIGPVVFNGGTQSNFSRTCDASGVCSAWKQVGSNWSVRKGNDPLSLLLSAGGDIYVRAKIGPDYTIEIGGTYHCNYNDFGSGHIDGVTGVGIGQMRAGYVCNISGGTGGPGGQQDYRPVALKSGTNCLAITDQVSGPTQGTRLKRVIVLRR